MRMIRYMNGSLYSLSICASVPPCDVLWSRKRIHDRFLAGSIASNTVESLSLSTGVLITCGDYRACLPSRAAFVLPAFLAVSV
jgi:hypothetical protein